MFTVFRHARKYMNSVKQADDYRATKLGQAMILLAMRTPEELQNKAVCLIFLILLKSYLLFMVN